MIMMQLPKISQRGHKHPGWKPATSTLWVLAPVIVFTAVLLALVAASAHQYLTHGAIIEITDSKTVSNVVFQYLPIILALVYGIIWGWIDLDVKRLAPWFELCERGGSYGKDSLLLEYPVNFPLSVPYQSAKRRQWYVFCTSVTVIAVYWGVTPLLGSLYTVRSTSISRTVPVTMMQGLGQLHTNNVQGPRFQYSALATQWFSQALPAFSTNSSTVTPVLRNYQQSFGRNRASLSYHTTKYTSELDCWTPAHTNVDNKTGAVTFDDGRGCVAKDLITVPNPSAIANTTFSGYYIGWNFDERLSYSLSSAGCSAEAAHRFLAIWIREHSRATNFKDPNSATALFCEPKYFAQDVVATVALPDYNLTAFSSIADRQDLTETSFNATLFEYILGTGLMPPTFVNSARTEIPDVSPLNQNTLLANRGIASPADNMVGFAVGATQLASEAYLNATILAQSFREAHQLLFALAVQDMLKVGNSEEDSMSAILVTMVDSVTIIPAIAVILATFLVAIMGATVYLAVKSCSRRSLLQQDPNSIANTIRQINNRNLFADLTRSCEDTKSAQTAITVETKFSIVQTSLGTSKVIANSSLSEKDKCHPSQIDSASQNERDEAPYHNKWESTELRMTAIAILALVLSASLVAISISKLLSDREEGLPLPGMSGLAEQVLLNYMPTLFSTLLEPIWSEITRLICIYLPFNELASRNSQEGASLDLTYAAYPPQMVIIAAARNGHYLISVLATTGLLSNILTIALNGLFSTASVPVHMSTLSQSLYSPAINQQTWDKSAGTSSGGLYAAYIVMANLSDKTVALPPWLGTQQFFLPQNITGGAGQAASFSTTAIGVGALLKCDELTYAASNLSYSLAFDSSMANANITVSYTTKTGTRYDCVPGSFYNTGDGSLQIAGDPSGNKAVEIVKPLKAPVGTNDTAHEDFCSGRLLYGWLRTQITLRDSVHIPYSDVTPLNTVEAVSVNISAATMLSCRPEVYSAPYNIIVSPTGTILSSTQAGLISNTTALATAFVDITSSINDYSQLTTSTHPVYHNDTIGSDWPNYMIKLLTNSTAILDPLQPPPEASDAISLVSDIYARNWAALLYTMSPLLDKPTKAENTTVPALKTYLTRKVFVNNTMFWIAFPILVWNIVMCMVLFVKMPKPFLLRVPVSIANIALFFAGSHCLDDFIDEGEEVKGCSFEAHPNPDNKSRFEHEFKDVSPAETSEKLYAYGHFIGTDGVPRVGIDRYPHAVPLNIRERRTWRFSSFQ